MLINIICQPRHKNNSGCQQDLSNSTESQSSSPHFQHRNSFGGFKENIGADVIGIFFFSFTLQPCTLKLVGWGNHGSKNIFLAHKSFTDRGLTERNAVCVQRATPHMENVSWLGLSRSKARLHNLSASAQNKHPIPKTRASTITEFLVIFGCAA